MAILVTGMRGKRETGKKNEGYHNRVYHNRVGGEFKSGKIGESYVTKRAEDRMRVRVNIPLVSVNSVKAGYVNVEKEAKAPARK